MRLKQTLPLLAIIKNQLLYILLWTALVAGSYTLSRSSSSQQGEEEAYSDAVYYYQKDIAFRRWAASHGGFYVTPDEMTPRNPYLSKVRNRDIVTTNGDSLTLMNPAYMLRQLQTYSKTPDFWGHITSLNPLNPINAPDPWEAEALLSFEKSPKQEVSGIVQQDGQDYMRLIRPVYIEKSCLKCHAHQGYRLGDLRGGISATVAMRGYRQAALDHLRSLGWSHFLIYLVGLLGVIILGLRNIHSKKEREQGEKLRIQLQQSQKMETIGTLAGGVAHDFNNILTVVNGYAEILLSELDENSPYREHAAIIHDSGNRASKLTKQLLTFSRKENYTPRFVKINDTVTELTKMLDRLTPASVHIDVDLEANPPTVSADTTQLEQILVNLVVNARDAILAKSSTKAHGRIVIETRTTELLGNETEILPKLEAGRYVRLRVQDTGIGISQANLPHIFEPFFTSKMKGQGTGLGLSTCYGILCQNKAGIYVESIENQGSTFCIYWPIHASTLVTSHLIE
jgi:signal transduction histidine kinase